MSTFESEIAADRFWAKSSCCTVFRKKGYYSETRKSEIVFDIAIEIRLPGATSYSMLVLIECKNYTHPVPVDDAEEFSAKVKQVGDLNAKAVLASTAAFQSGTLQFAKSTGMALLRYFGPTNFKWELQRSASASARTTSSEREPLIFDGLTQVNFTSQVFDLFLQSPDRLSNSLWDFFDDIAARSSMTQAQIRQVTNPRRLQVNAVPFLEKGDLETRADETLRAVSYNGPPVSLDLVCEREASLTGLQVHLHIAADETGQLGRIQFDPLQIDIYQQCAHPGRDRFTLAHELAHHLLDHGRYMRREHCDQSDLVLNRYGVDNGTDIARMEYQANYFAASLLMPRASFIADFWREMERLDLRDKGFGPLYVDDQQCNLDSYRSVVDSLTSRYLVSQQAVTIRLEGLGLLRDKRRRREPAAIDSVLAPAFARLADDYEALQH